MSCLLSETRLLWSALVAYFTFERKTNKPKQQIDFPYITTINDDARRILLGELNPIKYCVVEREDGYALTTRSEDLRIRSAEDFLTLILTWL